MKQLLEILAPYKNQRGTLIPILQKVQAELGFLSPEAITEIARFTGLSASEIFGVASFYAQFRFTRPGQHTVKVCLGTACHARGAQRILETVERDLKVKSGGTTEDGKFSLERVACFGACALAPVMVVDEKVDGRMTPTKAKETLGKY